MAILNSLINTGESRLLGKVYINDLDISNDLIIKGKIETEGSINIGKNTASNALIYLNNKLVIQVEDNWLKINEKVNNTQPFSSGVYFGNSIVRTDGKFQIGNNGANIEISSSAATFKVPTTITSTLNVNGDTTLNKAIITTANIDTANIQNVNVYDTLRAAKYSIETVQNLGGHFLVCPTIEVPSQGNESSFSCQVTRPSSTSDKLTIVFTDNSLSTDTFEGTKWAANSKVKVTGMINNVALGTCNGIISNWETANKRVEISITCGTAISSRFSTSTTPYTSDQVSDLSIMMYELCPNPNTAPDITYPIGVYLTAYGKNKYSYVDVYGGTSAKPTTRMGKLDGLDAVNGTSPTGWGFYSAQNGYFQGTIVSSAGKIGNWNLSTALYSGTNSITSTAVGIYLGTDGIRNYKDANTFVNIKDGVITAKAVDLTGKITASSGKIANWRIESTYLASGTATAPAANTLILSPAGTSSSYTIAGQAKTGWMITAGTTFGVNKDGGIYATSGNIGNWTIGTNDLHIGIWGSDDSAMLCTGTNGSKEIGGSDSINGWVFTAGANFGVTKTGALYANSAHISGEITATSGTIGGCNIVDGLLSVPAANITGTLSADRIGANTLTIGKFTEDDQDKILNENIQVGGRNLLSDTETFSDWFASNQDIVFHDGIIDAPSLSTKNWRYINSKSILFSEVKGKDIVLSFDVRSDEYETLPNGGYPSVSLYLKNEGPNANACSYRIRSRTFVIDTINNEWTRYTYTVPNISLSSFPTTHSDDPLIDDPWLSICIWFYHTESCQIRRPKLEIGNIATAWTLAPEDQEQGKVWYAECNTAAGTVNKEATITPTTSNFRLVQGTTINVKIVNTNSGAVGSLTLNVNNTGAKNIKYINNTGIANIPGVNYLVGGRTYQFIYDGTYWVITNMNYNTNSNNYDRRQHNQYIKAAEAITKAHIIAGTDAGYKMLASDLPFDLSYPILYSNVAIASGAQGYDVYEAYPSVNPSTTGTVEGLAVNKIVYLKGSLSGNTFTVATSNWLTCIIPMTEDGFYYIPLGMVANDATTKMYFSTSDKLYAYINGAFQRVDKGAATIATATHQYFWYDEDGAHIGTVEGDGVSGYNSLWNSYGLLLRKNENNLAAFTDSTVQFYDGQGNDPENIAASFGRTGAVMGNVGGNRLEVNGIGMTGYDTDGSKAFNIQFANANNTARIVEKTPVILRDYPSFFQPLTITPNATPADQTEMSYAITVVIKNSSNQSRSEVFSDTRDYDESDNTTHNRTFSISVPVYGSRYTLSWRMTYTGSDKSTTFTQWNLDGYNGRIVSVQIDHYLTALTSDVPSYTFGTRSNDPLDNGAYSFTAGEGLIASPDDQTVVGKYNIDDTNGDYAFIVGNGSDDSNRSNAFAVKWDGHIVSSGGGTFGGAISGTTGTFTGAISGASLSTTGSISGGAISGTTGTFTSNISAVKGTFSGAVTGASYSGGAISGTTGSFTGNVTHSANVLPDKTNARYLGTSDYRWQNLYSHYVNASATVTAGAVTSYTPSWKTNQDPVRYHCVVSAGICSFFFMGNGVAHSQGTVICTLPEGARPSSQVNAPFVKMSGNVVGVITITTAGEVSVGFISSTTSTGRIYFNCTYPVV